jgi:hypothetical protein
MFNLKRLAFALSPVLAAGVVAAVAMSTTAPGAAALRNAASKLSINALAAGGGGGGGGVDGLAITDASLVAHFAVNLTVTYVCRPVFDPNTGRFDVVMSSGVFGGVQERTGGKTIVGGSGFANATAICDEGLTPTPTINTVTFVVTPNFFPVNLPFKNGSALATVNVFACPNTFVASGVPPPCDFGNLGPTVIAIK